MTPTRAKFDGAEGIRLNNPNFIDGGFFRLRRGSTSPSGDCKQQLLWFTPEGKEPKLLYCNPDNDWFELSFTPIEKP